MCVLYCFLLLYFSSFFPSRISFRVALILSCQHASCEPASELIYRELTSLKSWTFQVCFLSCLELVIRPSSPYAEIRSASFSVENRVPPFWLVPDRQARFFFPFYPPSYGCLPGLYLYSIPFSYGRGFALFYGNLSSSRDFPFFFLFTYLPFFLFSPFRH